MTSETDLLDSRFVAADDGEHWLDLLTGRLIPLISGSDGEDDEEGDDSDGDEQDDGDDNAQLQAALTKSNRAGAKKAVRDLARKHGFGSRAELEQFLEQNAASDGDGDEEEEQQEPSGDDGGQQKPPAKKPPRQPVTNDPIRQRELRLEIREALAEANVAPSKARLATASVVGSVDLTDADLDAEDIAEVVEQMKSSEPGWFLSDDDGGSGDGQPKVVPGAPGRPPSKKVNKTSEEIAREAYEANKKARAPRKRLLGQSTQ